jgi:hypothetical protein
MVVRANGSWELTFYRAGGGIELFSQFRDPLAFEGISLPVLRSFLNPWLVLMSLTVFVCDGSPKHFSAISRSDISLRRISLSVSSSIALVIGILDIIVAVGPPLNNFTTRRFLARVSFTREKLVTYERSSDCNEAKSRSHNRSTCRTTPHI